MMKIEVAPVATMACVAMIAISLVHSKSCNFDEQFDAVTVALLSLIINRAPANRSKRLYSVRYNEVC